MLVVIQKPASQLGNSNRLKRKQRRCPARQLGVDLGGQLSSRRGADNKKPGPPVYDGADAFVIVP